MKLLSAILIFLTLASSVCELIQLFSASIDRSSTSTTLRGSLRGGTSIYIYGLGFPRDPRLVQVWIGYKQCFIPNNGVTPTMITCQTSNSDSDVDVSSLEIVVISNGESFTLPSNTYSYREANTPQITDIFPSSSVPGSSINFYGKHRVNNYGDGLRDTGDFIGVYIGDTLCSMFDVPQNRITYNDVTRLQCLQSSTQTAGKKNVSEHVLSGLSKTHDSLRKASLQYEFYEYAVLPEIISISPNSGFETGQTIKITGNGFSTNKDDMEVSIDGVDCQISISTNKQILCQVQPKNENNSALLNTNSSSQINGYIAGSGFDYQRYDTTVLSSKTISSLKNAILNNPANLTLIQSKKVFELRSPDIYGTNYAQVFKGYFFAPVSGNYTFRGSSDDFFEFSMSQESGTTSGNLNRIIYSNTNGQSSDNYYISNISSALGSPIYLQEGNYYYSELYHLNNAGSGWLKVSVQVPNSKQFLPKQTFEVDHIETTFTNQPEIIEFTLSNAHSGNFNISLKRMNTRTLQITYTNEVTINFNATASQFISALNQFDGFYNQGISCLSVVSYDDLNEIVPTYSGVKTVWTVQIYRLRNSTHLSQKFNFKLDNIVNSTSTATFGQVRIQDHSPLITGSFTIEIGGQSIAIYDQLTQTYSNSYIPFDVSSDTLQNALRQIPGLKNVQVSRTGEPSYGSVWIISFIDFNQPIEEIIVSASGLIGGKEGTSPQIGAYQDRAFSSNILFNPVNQKLLFSAASNPQVIVKVNGMESACKNDCSYSFLSVIPKILSQSIVNGTNGAQISIQIEDPLNADYDLSEIKVSLDNVDCEIQAGTFTDFTCTLPLIENSVKPAIAAGTYSARVSVSEGVVNTPSTLQSLVWQYTFEYFIPSRGPMTGGIPVTIVGTGFNPNPKSNLIQMCGWNTNITVTQSNYTHLTFILPPCDWPADELQIIIVSLKPSGQGNGAVFLLPGDANIFEYYSTAYSGSVMSVSPQSSSPVVKTPLIITGYGFGSNKTAISVYLLQNGIRTYQLAVLELNDTYIKAGLGGGKKGNYKVQVILDGIGEINVSSSGVNDFSYEVYIESITENGTAVHLVDFLSSGGNLITIIGKNFIPNKEETTVLVFFDSICQIETINETVITCLLPQTNILLVYANNNKPTGFVMRVYSKLTEVADCRTQCIINYNNALTTPMNFKIANVTPQTVVSGPTQTTLDFYGTFNGSNVKLTYFDLKNTITKQKYVFPFELKVKNQASFTLPANLVSGLYEIRGGAVKGHGIPFPFIILASFKTTTGVASIYGGNVVTLEGTGLPDSWPSQGFSFTITVNNQVYIPQVLSCSRTSFSFRTPSTNSPNNAKMVAKLTCPSGKFITYTITQLVSATPQVNYNNATQINAGTTAIQLTQTSLTNQLPTEVSVFNILNEQEFDVVSGWTRSGNNINFNYQFKAGAWKFRLLYPNGYTFVSTTVSVLPTSNYSLNHTEVSYAGGVIKVSNGDITKNSIVRVLGFDGHVVNLDNGVATFTVPPLVTPQIQSLYPTLAQPIVIQGSPISDGGSSPISAFDNVFSSFYQSSNSQCFIGIDIGQGKLAKITKIKYFPYYMWARSSEYISGAIFEASVDGINYTKIGEIDQSAKSGWNSFPINSNQNYRFVRLAHDNKSQCRVSEIEVIGIVYSDIEIINTSSKTLDVVLFDGVTTKTFTDSITYSLAQTPIVTAVSPKVGSVSGGELITITGTKFSIGTPKIVIDGIECEIVNGSITSTSVSCLTGLRATSPNQNTFEVSFGGSYAIIQQSFLYVQRWSDDRTWGIDVPPSEGDLVYVPSGMTLLVDKSTPKLAGIIVLGGKIIFADQSDIQVHTDLLTIFNGSLIAGTQSSPYQHKLTIVVYGNVRSKQLPIFGNKVIGCFNCKLSLFGSARVKQWTELSSSIVAGTKTLTVSESIDWKVGETIVVASTGFNHKQSEQRLITAVTGQTITVDQNFNYNHLSQSEVYGNHTLAMKAEVALLNRNIVIKGDSSSDVTNFGVNILISGDASDGLVAQIANIQLSNCGQAAQLKYCINFQANGDLADSFVKGVSIHNSYARGIVLNGEISFVQVSNNVLYNIKGHGIALQTASENFNTFKNNLVISVYSSYDLYQTDISVSAFYITNPSNTLIGNRAAGSDFYGFWFPIQNSVSRDVCPTGSPLGYVKDSVIHSSGVYGFRINRLSARNFPCKSLRNQKDEDPYSANPSIQSVFNSFILYKNVQSNILVEQIGNTLFTNFTLAESKQSSIELYRTNLTKQLVEVQDFAIVGVSTTNPQADLSYYNGNKGVIAPRTSGFKLSNTHFYNFPANTTLFETCSGCSNANIGSNSVNEYLIETINFSNISGRYVSLGTRLNDIIYDLDGSFSTNFDGASRNKLTFVGNLNHFIGEQDCIPSSSSKWSGVLLCEQNVTIRKVTFTNIQNTDLFRGVYAKVQRIDNIYDTIEQSSYNSTNFYNLQNGYGQSMYTSIIYQYSLPFVTGRTYAIWWESIDFNNLAIDISPLFDDSDSGIIFKFNYTAHRELFDIYHLINLEKSGDSIMPFINDTINETDCELGENIVDLDNKTFSVCVSSKGKNRTEQYLQIDAIKCRYVCEESDQFEKENFYRLWSNATQWPEGRLPIAGENVTIKGPWTVILDMTPADINFLTIDGTLTVPNTLASGHSITANNIWVRAGVFQIGTSQSVPYPGRFTITLKGSNSNAFTQDLSGRKIFLNTGKVNFFGSSPVDEVTRMVSLARKGDTTIQVTSPVSDWAIGDKIVIGPTWRNQSQHEKVTITAINSTSKTITFTPPLKFSHYGNISTYFPPWKTVQSNLPYQYLDCRGAVINLNRKIVVQSAGDDIGFHMLFKGYLAGERLRSGSGTLQGVQFIGGGQTNTEHNSLRIVNTVGSQKIILKKNSFENCLNGCLDASNPLWLEVIDNVFFNAEIFHIRALKVDGNLTLDSNTMIGVYKRKSLKVNQQQMVGCILAYDYIYQKNIFVKNNLCQGSEVHGYALPFTQADTMQYNWQIGLNFNNTVGSAQIGFIYGQTYDAWFVALFTFNVYACDIGFLANTYQTSTVHVRYGIIADCKVGTDIQIRNKNSTYYMNMAKPFHMAYIAVLRPDCPQCYGPETTPCANNVAMRPVTVVQQDRRMPNYFGINYNAINGDPSVSATLAVAISIFDSWRSSYTNLPQCYNNTLIKAKQEWTDYISPVTFEANGVESIIINCDESSIVRFLEPRTDDLGYYGGCGDMKCQGHQHYYVTNLTRPYFGQFMERVYTYIPHKEIGANQPDCQWWPIINGYKCTVLPRLTSFAVIDFASIAPDYRSRVVWPVFVNYDGGRWNVSINAPKQRHWSGPNPLGTRISRFHALTRCNTTTNVVFSKQVPTDMIFRMNVAYESGDGLNVTVRLQYSTPNSIRVSTLSAGVIRPSTTTSDDVRKLYNILNSTSCGFHQYFYENNTIQFTLVRVPNCIVRLTVTNSIQLTAWLSMDINDFYAMDGENLFVNRIAAALNITDRSRVKIVGVYSGSVNIIAYIEETITSTFENSTQANPASGQQQMLELHERLRLMNQNGEIALALGSAGLPLADLSTALYFNNIEQEKRQEEQKKTKTLIIGLIIGVSVGGAIILVIGFVAVMYFLKRRGKVEQINVDQENTNTIKIERKLGQDNSSLTDFEIKNIRGFDKD